jgi:alkanesulfonate monooxygenase SsuD/methylene tetrahydromethanopterin reductase-like flavin-dependent oxidoreductase (luciferase family)
MATARALRRDPLDSADSFPDDVQKLQAYLEPALPSQKTRAVPGPGTRVPIWLLGSSLFSAQLAAALGLPFAFASHFAPTDLMQAFAVNRKRFKPSRQLKRPYAMMGVNQCPVLPTQSFPQSSHTRSRVLFAQTLERFRKLPRLPPPG